jgi:hypothetical protein
MDPLELASAVLPAITRYLATLGDAAAEEAAKASGKAALDWIKGKLTSPAGKDAVARLEAAPEKPLVAEALKSQLAMWLDENPGAAAELQSLLTVGGFSAQTANFIGDNNKIGQADRNSSVVIK